MVREGHRRGGGAGFELFSRAGESLDPVSFCEAGGDAEGGGGKVGEGKGGRERVEKLKRVKRVERLKGNWLSARQQSFKWSVTNLTGLAGF